MTSDVLRGPFGSTRGALGYVGLLAATLLAPCALGAVRDRRLAYEEMPVTAGPFAFLEQQTFDRAGDIDVLFLAPSTLWSAIDTRFVEEALSDRLGRRATVLTFGANFRGEDVFYELLSELLEHRRVKTVVFQMPDDTQTRDVPWTFDDHFLPATGPDAIDGGLPVRYRLQLYADSVLGSPRRVLSLLRRNVVDLQSEAAGVEVAGRWYATAPADAQVGAVLVHAGFDGAPFVPRDDPPPDVAPSDLVLGPSSRTRFHFSHEPLLPYQAHFVDRLFALMRAHGVRPVLLHVPLFGDQDSATVDERFDWSETYGRDVAVVGIPPREAFRGAGREETKAYYYNGHLNANGARLFTRAVTPALVAIHAGSAPDL